MTQLRRHLRERSIVVTISPHASFRARTRCDRRLVNKRIRAEVKDAITGHRRSYYRPHWLGASEADHGKRLPVGMEYVWDVACTRVYVLRRERDTSERWVVLTVLARPED